MRQRLAIHVHVVPKTEPKFFADTPDAVYVTPLGAQYPGGKVPDAVACNGCPSSGGSQ